MAAKNLPKIPTFSSRYLLTVWNSKVSCVYFLNISEVIRIIAVGYRVLLCPITKWCITQNCASERNVSLNKEHLRFCFFFVTKYPEGSSDKWHPPHLTQKWKHTVLTVCRSSKAVFTGHISWLINKQGWIFTKIWKWAKANYAALRHLGDAYCCMFCTTVTCCCHQFNFHINLAQTLVAAAQSKHKRPSGTIDDLKEQWGCKTLITVWEFPVLKCCYLCSLC